jgi:RNA polymerase sigma-70 factor (ECF subfamily)
MSASGVIDYEDGMATIALLARMTHDPAAENTQDSPALASAELKDRFVQDNLQRIFRQIYRMVGNVHDAQDLTQEAFIKALQRQDQLKDEVKASHWLSRIATNTALDFLRRHGRVAFCEIEELPHAETPRSRTDSPETTMLRSQQRDWLAAGLERLTPRERAALVLRDMEDLPAEEVARRLSCSRATVRSHIANARAKLKKFAERRKQ